jgi:hypothetical protein
MNNTQKLMSLSLSRSAMADEVMALSALRGYMAPSDSYMASLLPEHDTILNTVIRHAIVYVTTALADAVEECDLEDFEVDTVELTVRVRSNLPDNGAKQLRRLIEGAVVSNAMERCYEGIDAATATYYQEECRERMSRLRQMLHVRSPRLKPSF